MPAAPRLSADDWVDAAWARFREAGLGAVRVEVVARDLGATKGSFYWHFDDRRALVSAVVARWEAAEAERAAAATAAAPGPRLRLARLLGEVADDAVRGEQRLYLEADAEGVGDAVARVTAARTDAVTGVLVELGVVLDDARHRAALALAAVLGLDQLAQVGAVADGAERSRLALHLLELVAPTPPR